MDNYPNQPRAERRRLGHKEGRNRATSAIFPVAVAVPCTRQHFHVRVFVASEFLRRQYVRGKGGEGRFRQYMSLPQPNRGLELNADGSIPSSRISAGINGYSDTKGTEVESGPV